MSSREIMIGDKPLSSLRVVDLKAELEKRGLPKSGSKKDLVDRLKGKVLLDMEKEEVAGSVPNTDEVELPNISAKLPDDNPFVREYLASQAELFHSQQVAKKLYREELKKESEGSGASADEREKSPLKSPVKVTDNNALPTEGEIEGKSEDKSPLESPVNEVKSNALRVEGEVKVKHEEPKVSGEEPEQAPSKSPVKSVESNSLTVGEEAEKKSEGNGVIAKERESSPEKIIEKAKLAENSSVTIEEEDSKSTPENNTVSTHVQENSAVETPTEEREDDTSPVAEEQKPGPECGSTSIREDEKCSTQISEKTEGNESLGSKTDEESKEKSEASSTNVEVQEKSPIQSAAKMVEIDCLAPEEDLQGKHEDTGTPIDEHEKAPLKSPAKITETISSTPEEEEVKEKPDQSVSTYLEGRQKKPVDKENILDEVLDYGEEDSVGMEFEESNTSTETLKKPQILETPEKSGLDRPLLIHSERRVIRLKPNKHSQRRREKYLESCEAAEKESSKEELVVTAEFLNQYFHGTEIELLTEEELNLEENPSPSEPATRPKVRITRTISVADTADSESLAGEAGGGSGEEEEAAPPHEMDLTIQRRISIVSMEEEVAKAQTPPRRTPTQLILVTNLVRPFTVPQLKELLQRTGNVVDLWVDKIKSKCVAKYDTEDEAVETRTALHGVKWPSSNPKSLSVDFTTEERVSDLRKKDSGYVEEKPVSAQHVREWDVGKKSPRRKRSHSRGDEKDKDRKRNRRSPSPGRERRRSRSRHSQRKERNGEVKKSDSSGSGKTLDELFRKTVATPCIYWLPLNPQQIAEKEEYRRKRMEERERRIAEMQQQHRAQR